MGPQAWAGDDRQSEAAMKPDRAGLRMAPFHNADDAAGKPVDAKERMSGGDRCRTAGNGSGLDTR
ncbi:hypothetical protein NUTIK01_31650 [Novosphingobium sp. IK01]|uniref:Uncharacterized protein n=1 Tax=Novosphingobium pituita TaxID=3056842 RepID=A0ABQ6PAU5_9SPHN|nr:hypothetical protein NUTIK01_31650 [Novosphingobium sp. IK01]